MKRRFLALAASTVAQARFTMAQVQTRPAEVRDRSRHPRMSA